MLDRPDPAVGTSPTASQIAKESREFFHFLAELSRPCTSLQVLWVGSVLLGRKPVTK